MTDKIYLRVVQDDERVYVVDQNGREVANVISVSATSSVSDWSTATVELYQAKSETERLINGVFEGASK